MESTSGAADPNALRGAAGEAALGPWGSRRESGVGLDRAETGSDRESGLDRALGSLQPPTSGGTGAVSKLRKRRVRRGPEPDT